MRDRVRPASACSTRATVWGAWLTYPVSTSVAHPSRSNASTLFDDNQPRSNTRSVSGRASTDIALGALAVVLSGRLGGALTRSPSKLRATRRQLRQDRALAAGVERGPTRDL